MSSGTESTWAGCLLNSNGAGGACNRGPTVTVGNGQAVAVAIEVDDLALLRLEHGRAAVDELLQQIGARLRSCALGGFQAFPWGIFECVMADLYALSTALMEPVTVSCGTIPFTASMGWAEVDGAREAQTAAHVALREAQGARRQAIGSFGTSLVTNALRRRTIQTRLSEALRAGRISPMYQRIVDLRTGAWEVEALARWNDPVLGSVSPVEFIPVAEETGAIQELGRQVLTEAVSKAATWFQCGAEFPTRVAVNASRAQLAGDFAADVGRVLGHYRLPPDRLQIEVTESIAADDAAVRECLHALKALGVGLALDDFGAGYSSLGSLLALPLDTLKLDRAFTIATDPRSELMLRPLISGVAAAGMVVVGEGVETAEQVRRVRELGCHKAQGFYLAKPLPPDELVPVAGEVERTQGRRRDG